MVSTASAEWSGLDSHAALRLANVDPQPIGAAFNGSGTFTFSEPRRFTIVNRSTGRTGRGVVPMTGTINATIVGDDYSYEHDHALPGFTFEGRMKGRINRGAATLSTMSGPAHARVSDVSETVKSVETLGFPVAAIMHEVHGPMDAPMTLGGSYRYPEVDTAVTSEALVVPLLGEVRAAASVVADTRAATITKIDIRRGTSTITGDVKADITNRAWSGTLHVESPNAEELQTRDSRRVARERTVECRRDSRWHLRRLPSRYDDQRPRAHLGRPVDRSRHGQGHRHRRRHRRDVAAVVPGCGLSRWTRALRVGDRRVRRQPQRRSPLVAGHFVVAERHAGDVCDAVRWRRHRRASQRARRASTSR